MRMTGERRPIAMGDSEDIAFRCPDLHREVSSFAAEREAGLLGELSSAIGVAPDVDRGLALLTLAEARQAQLDRLCLLGARPAVAAHHGDSEREWASLVLDVTVGAKLGGVFFAVLQELLDDEHILALEVLARHEPQAGQILWEDALTHQDMVPAALFRVVDRCTQALLARPALQARIGHDGTLGLFASTMDALPGIFRA